MAEQEDRSETVLRAARAVMEVAVKGMPAVRASLHAARIGAGASFAPAVLENLGLRVLPQAAQVAATMVVGGPAAGAALVLKRGARVLRAGLREMVYHSPEGVTLRVTPSGSTSAAVSHEAVRAAASAGRRVALRGVGKAVLHGAIAGAVLDGAFAGVRGLRGWYRGELTPQDAARHVGVSMARGAVTGAVGVSAAGVVSAGLAFTGLSVVGAPVAVPIATMVVAGMAAEYVLDRASLLVAPAELHSIRARVESETPQG